MKEYAAENIRNVALTGHGSTGKTSLSEAMLFNAKAINRLGRVDDGNTTSDFDPDEVRRSFSVNLSVLPCEWQSNKLNILDTPGYADFVGEVKCGVRAADAAVIVVCGASGVQVGTEYAWIYADEQNLPRLVFINRMERENADFHQTLSQLQGMFGQKCVAFQLPLGAQADFRGVVDLLTMKAYVGEKGEAQEVPEELIEQAASLREKLVEAAAETDDALITKYLEGEDLTEDELRQGLKTGVCQGSLIPVLTGSATKNVAVTLLMDALCSYVPSPADMAVAVKDGESIKADAKGPLAALVFKTTADPYVGRLTYFRVYSGTLKADSQAWNANKGSAERIGPLYLIRGKSQEQVSQVVAGDLGAVAKLAETSTGDTLTTREKSIILPGISFPEPAFSGAVHPKSKADLDKMGSALSRIAEEDPTLRVSRSQDTSETIMSGLGDSHVEVAVEKIRRKFGVDLEMTTPKVPYKETITAGSSAEYTHKKQTGGHGQYARVAIELEPLPRGSGFEFTNRIVGGVVPKQYISSVEKGIVEAMHEGVLARYPLIDMKATLFDGKDHPVDSSDIAFKIAAAAALKKGAQDAHPVLLEPIMNLQVAVPEANTGDVISDLNGKRAKVMGMTPEGTRTVIEAQAPMAEVQHYAADLRSMTQGRGSYSMQFSHYEEVPAHVVQHIIEQAEEKKG
ncbi:MAG: elongation factor G [Dehalococcoidia bacterium]|nr:MAG: elongation factor G [Dehalococcoidia bacterium]